MPNIRNEDKYSYKDEYSVKVSFNDEINRTIRDSKDEVESITVAIEATHSNKVNGNYWMYTEQALIDSADSFIKPYNKPVTSTHDVNDDVTIGRVVESRYISYGLNNSLSSVKRLDDKNMKAARLFVSSDEHNNSGYKGAGELFLVATITDQDAIKKIRSEQYLTVSIGGAVKDYYPSIKEVVLDEDEKITPWPGYRDQDTGETVFYVANKIEFNHVAFVAVPADENAKLKQVMDSLEQVPELRVIDCKISTKEDSMKLSISDLKKSEIPSLFHSFVESLGIKDFQLSDNEEMSSADFLFVSEEGRSLCMQDALSTSLIYKFIKDEVEDSPEKDTMLQVIQDKLEELKVTDVEKVINDAKVQEDENSDKAEKNTISTPTVEEISDAVVEKLKSVLTVSDTYASGRINMLQREVRSLNDQLKEARKHIKDNLVERIAELEQLEDEEKAQLSTRTTESLTDKLHDILAKNMKNQDQTQITDAKKIEKVQDEHQIADSIEEDTDEEDQEEEGQPQLTYLSDKQVLSDYLSIISKQGLAAASRYISDLKKEGKVAEDFSFTRT